MKKSIGKVLCLVILLNGFALALQCDYFEFSSSDWNSYVYKTELLAKAKIDECFMGLGDPCSIYPFYGSYDDCYNLGGTSKVNQAYVWGLAKAGDNLWFGTAPNVHCMVIGGYLGMDGPIQTDSYVCEFGDSAFSPPVPSEIGDWRPPNFFVYNTVTKNLTNLAPVIIAGGDMMRIQTSLGIRSAGAHNNVVFLAGPALQPYGMISLFAFNTVTFDYLGSHILPYGNIRKWQVAEDSLYTSAGSCVLKWVGDANDPFHFEVVGNLKGQGAELAYHQGRIFISTWPGEELVGANSNAGLWMSPVLDGSLTQDDADDWVKVWDVNDYEPDPVIAATYGGGAVESFGDYLYWGTMHVPFLSTQAHIFVYGEPVDEAAFITAALRCHRAISIFRGKNFSSTPQIDLLYGESSLDAYHPIAGWQNVPTGYEPMYGASGIDNFFNNYTWTMAVYDDQLFVGTMDWNYLVTGSLGLPDMPMFPMIPAQCAGADLYRFPSTNSPAVPVSLAGVGNYSNYGIRTMVSDDSLYMGSANPMNLLTNPYDDKPEGGWELRKLVLCKTQLAGDINRDGIVDLIDFAIMANNWLDEVGSCE